MIPMPENTIAHWSKDYRIGNAWGVLGPGVVFGTSVFDSLRRWLGPENLLGCDTRESLESTRPPSLCCCRGGFMLLICRRVAGRYGTEQVLLLTCASTGSLTPP